MKVVRKLGRCAPVLLGAVLAAASVAAGGTPAVALAPGVHHPGPSSVRAEVLALLGHHGLTAGRPGAGTQAAGVPAAVPMPGTGSNLSGVFCTSASNCLAVGGFGAKNTGARLNQVLRWNGTKWSRVSVPSQGGTAAGDFSELNAVRCRTVSDCWAVGDYDSGGATLNQALHWNGSAWKVISTPDPGGTVRGDLNELLDVVCPGASNCWAAGEYGDETVNLNEVLHWNGTAWTLAKALPQPAGTSTGDIQALGSIRCTSASSCLAVGTEGTDANTIFQNEALRWNGTAWSTLAVTSPGGTADGDISELVSLACTSRTNCWAAGEYGSFSAAGLTSLNQIMHWNGTAWSLALTIANPDGSGQGAVNELNGATCSSATNCWAVGNFGSIQDGAGEQLNQALHWDGTTWTLLTPTNPGGISDGDTNALMAVRCTSTADCWAVGTAMTPNVNVALHWNGAAWSIG